MSVQNKEMDQNDGKEVVDTNSQMSNELLADAHNAPDIPIMPCCSQSHADIPIDSLDYAMNNAKIGLCVIFNNEKFTSEEKLSPRLGSDRDVNALNNSFGRLGFDVKICTDYSKKEMSKYLEKIALSDHSNHDCFVCCILTHGGENGTLYAKDHAYLIDNITGYFTGDNCPSLAGKPKIFIIQACRGLKFDKGVVIKSRDVTDSDYKTINIPNLSDFLFAYSTMPGFFSFRNTSTGSWFITNLTQVLDQYAFDMDLLSILTIVNRRVAFNHLSRSDIPEMNGKKQMPCVKHCLTARLFFKTNASVTVKEISDLQSENKTEAVSHYD